MRRICHAVGYQIVMVIVAREKGAVKRGETILSRSPHCMAGEGNRQAVQFQFPVSNTAEHTPSAAAENIRQKAQAQIRSRIAAHAEATEVPRMAAVSRAAVFDLLQRI